MDRNGRVITKFNVWVYDDGWNLPHEVVEEIEYRIVEARSSAVKRVNEAHDKHKGDWLTMEIAKEYAARAWLCRKIGRSLYVGEIRNLGMELQKLYGVTELEAINILFEHNVNDYVNKYYRIQNRIPDIINPQFICDVIVDEYREAIDF